MSRTAQQNSAKAQSQEVPQTTGQKATTDQSSIPEEMPPKRARYVRQSYFSSTVQNYGQPVVQVSRSEFSDGNGKTVRTKERRIGDKRAVSTFESVGDTEEPAPNVKYDNTDADDFEAAWTNLHKTYDQIDDKIKDQTGTDEAAHDQPKAITGEKLPRAIVRDDDESKVDEDDDELQNRGQTRETAAAATDRGAAPNHARAHAHAHAHAQARAHQRLRRIASLDPFRNFGGSCMERGCTNSLSEFIQDSFRDFDQPRSLFGRYEHPFIRRQHRPRSLVFRVF